MPFIPHTEADVQAMLQRIGVDEIDQLFDEIPADLRQVSLDGVPEGMNEMAISRLMRERAAMDGMPLCYAGAGAYDHHVPAAIWQIVTRGEYYTAYTPYQAEASQGTLQLIYEYQSMMARLMAMEVSNASLYDGASGLAEAVLMAIRLQRKSRQRRVLVPQSLHPAYREVLQTIVGLQDIQLVEVPFDTQTGTTPLTQWQQAAGEEVTAVVLPQPNYFGRLEAVDAITDWAHEQNALVIGVVNPMLAALLKPPGQWGKKGADIACGEGQPLGVPLSSGGPYFGFMTTRQSMVRQMPGRLCGRTTDLDGKVGYTLTLQAREQHIRRGRANSNICTNQGLVVAAATLYMALMGGAGLQQVARASLASANSLREALLQLPGVEPLFTADGVHEFALRLPVAAEDFIEAMAAHGILAGVDLEADYPALGHALLVCATETRGEQDHARYLQAAREVLGG